MVYANSHLGFCIENKKLSIKACDEVVNDTGVKFPYVFAADDAFVLKLNTMKPQPGQKLTIVRLIFIYRLSRAKKVIENAFGIFSSRFRIFRRPMIANVYEVVKVTKACVAPHFFLMKTNNATVIQTNTTLWFTEKPAELQVKDEVIGEGRKILCTSAS